MLNKELLMIQTELPPVHVVLKFYGEPNSRTDFTWTSPDGTVKTEGVSVVLKDLRTVITVGLLNLSNRLSK